ncbi:DUF1416 domain-containing protein [Nakamurella sp. YIM 132087]|uniref:DUF1416 domain-containing protein n=1 Tax=Nakamurella alba TaxID=2665158 RepID=A0A7K1FPN1_9ACTN|nr:DUF1416 domain-containing protein [Nakamurella alba]MTD16102.1 DUF1416 domain-containing protein [Nakamurella alba]
MTASCGAPEQTADLPAGFDATSASVLQGKVLAGNAPVAGAFVRLLDSTGEFTAEVVSSADGDFRFFAAPGDWTVRALSRSGNGSAPVTVGTGVHPVDVLVA